MFIPNLVQFCLTKKATIPVVVDIIIIMILLPHNMKKSIVDKIGFLFLIEPFIIRKLNSALKISLF